MKKTALERASRRRSLIIINEKKKIKSEMIWWSSGSDSVFSMQGARVPSLVRELDPTCCN